MSRTSRIREDLTPSLTEEERRQAKQYEAELNAAYQRQEAERARERAELSATWPDKKAEMALQVGLDPEDNPTLQQIAEARKAMTKKRISDLDIN